MEKPTVTATWCSPGALVAVNSPRYRAKVELEFALYCVHSITKRNTMLCLIITLGVLLQAALPTTATNLDISLASRLVETCTLGGILWVVLKNQEQRWQATLKQSEERFSSLQRESDEAYKGLLRQMEATMMRDIEERGKAMKEWEQLKDSKFCIYQREQAKAIAAEISRLQEGK